MTELICITCPKGCHLRVDEEKGFAVTGTAVLEVRSTEETNCSTRFAR